ncbi:MAG: hypothetical protein ACRCT8_07395 [Lacipirellulaceae bacterium]
MNSTDRAFIAAYQRSVALGTPAPVTPAMHSAAHGPHFPVSRAPLSQRIGERREAQASRDADSPAAAPAQRAALFTPAIELDAFTWPDAARALAAACERELLGLVDRFSRSERRSVALVGDGAGAGLTTLALALARVAAGAGLRTAIIDAGPRHGVALGLGLHRVARLCTAATSVDSVTVGSRSDKLSIVVLDDACDDATLEASIDRLAATHDLVLVDAGHVSDDSQRAVAIAGLGVIDAALVSPCGDGGARRRAAAEGLLVSSGARVVGVVETLAPLGSAGAAATLFQGSPLLGAT